jgi:ribonucleoside-diphosphate reductase alpha chain
MSKVIKKDGSEDDFDISKIRRKILPACEGTDINPLEFESLVQVDTSHKIKSTDIQEKLVQTAKNNVSSDNPDWDIVAGRLMAQQLQTEVWKNTKFDIEDFADHYNYLIRNNYYRQDLKTMYDEDELDKCALLIKPKRDYNLILPQVALLKSKYLIHNRKGVLEYPSTADLTNSMILASIETNKYKYAKEYYDLLSTYVLSLATPFKTNLRVPNGNTGSCFIGEMPDNTAGIFKTYSDMAQISQEGGGIGWYLGRVRPGDTYSQRVPKANKITKWVKIINDIAVAVNQRGIRKGAITPALDWWHLDIIDFCEVKSELNGDLRDKSFDIFPQVVVDKFFIDRVIAKADVYQYNQYDFKKLTGIDICDLIGKELYDAHLLAEELILSGKLKHFTKIKANVLWKKFLATWIEYGDFYIAHKDNINISNYVTSIGIAKCVNLCTESWSISKPVTKWKTESDENGTNTTESDGLTHSCLIGSTEIETNEGFMRLDDAIDIVNSGKKIFVKSYNIDEKSVEFNKILAGAMTRKSAKLMKITHNNKEVICTPDHKIFTSNRGYIEAKDLLTTDELVEE